MSKMGNGFPNFFRKSGYEEISHETGQLFLTQISESCYCYCSLWREFEITFHPNDRSIFPVKSSRPPLALKSFLALVVAMES